MYFIKRLIDKMNLALLLNFIVLIISTVLVIGCYNSSTQRVLPVLGDKKVVNGDTVFHQVGDFIFTDQDGMTINAETFENKIYVTDFFFTSCPSICPRMKQQMIRVQQRFKDNNGIMLLSHSIDPLYDTPAVLKDYAQKLNIDTRSWKLVTGDKQSIQTIAERYFVSVAEDSTAPGGYLHGGHFILVDRKQRIRGYYDGTDPVSVDELMQDMDLLLKE